MITLLVQSPSDKIVLIKSERFNNQMVLPYIESEINSDIQTLIRTHIEHMLGITVSEVEFLKEGEFKNEQETNKFYSYLVKITEESIGNSDSGIKAILVDPHKAIKIVFEEPFTLNIIDYLKKIGD